MVLFSATASSIGRVTNCSTCCAVAPGHEQKATATRTGMSGSFRCGMRWYPNQPHTRTPMSSTHETFGCSTKNLGALWVFSIRSWSFLYAMDFVCLRNRLDGVAILQKLRTYGDHSLAGLDSFDGNCIVMGCPKLHLA